jgi:hypothetical protein
MKYCILILILNLNILSYDINFKLIKIFNSFMKL